MATARLVGLRVMRPEALAQAPTVEAATRVALEWMPWDLASMQGAREQTEALVQFHLQGFQTKAE